MLMFLNNKTLFHHFQFLSNALKKHQLEGSLDFDTFEVCLTLSSGNIFLYPAFDVVVNGDRAFYHLFLENFTGFSGWRLFPFKEIESLSDKIKIKKFFINQDIPTPDYSLKISETIQYDFIIKDKKGSFSKGITGPFKPNEISHLSLDENHYLEAFLPGTLIKAWFLNKLLVCIEFREMATIRGDGVNTIKTLSNDYFSRIKKEINYSELETLLIYCEKKLDTVLNPNQKQLIDFRFTRSLWGNRSCFSYELSQNESILKVALERTGEIIYHGLKQEMEGVVYTVDAIWNPPGQYSALEINYYPGIHPYIYQAMVDYLLNKEGEQP
jgi:hypothetical protein